MKSVVGDGVGLQLLYNAAMARTMLVVSSSGATCVFLIRLASPKARCGPLSPNSLFGTFGMPFLDRTKLQLMLVEFRSVGSDDAFEYLSVEFDMHEYLSPGRLCQMLYMSSNMSSCYRALHDWDHSTVNASASHWTKYSLSELSRGVDKGVSSFSPHGQCTTHHLPQMTLRRGPGKVTTS